MLVCELGTQMLEKNWLYSPLLFFDVEMYDIVVVSYMMPDKFTSEEHYKNHVPQFR